MGVSIVVWGEIVNPTSAVEPQGSRRQCNCFNRKGFTLASLQQRIVWL